MFTCNGRGMQLFGEPDHDAAVVTESVGTHGRGRHVLRRRDRPRRWPPFLHGFTAVTVLFQSAPPSLRFPP